MKDVLPKTLMSVDPSFFVTESFLYLFTFGKTRTDTDTSIFLFRCYCFLGRRELFPLVNEGNMFPLKSSILSAEVGR